VWRDHQNAFFPDATGWASGSIPADVRAGTHRPVRMRKADSPPENAGNASGRRMRRRRGIRSGAWPVTRNTRLSPNGISTGFGPTPHRRRRGRVRPRKRRCLGMRRLCRFTTGSSEKWPVLHPRYGALRRNRRPLAAASIGCRGPASSRAAGDASDAAGRHAALRRKRARFDHAFCRRWAEDHRGRAGPGRASPARRSAERA